MSYIGIGLRLAVFSIFFCLPLTFSNNASADYATDLQNSIYLQNDSGYIDAGAYSVPVVYDWNGDGKKDLLVGQNNGGNGYISYYENNGTDDAPFFSAPSYIQSCSPVCTNLNVTAQG